MPNIAVIFDLDGTLVDSLRDICYHLNRVRTRQGLPELPVNKIQPYIGKGARYLLEMSSPDLPLENLPIYVDEYRVSYVDHPVAFGAPFPGVVETLKALRSHPNVRLGIATNKPTSAAELTLKAYLPGISFDAVMGPEKVSHIKPHPAHLLDTLKALKVEPQSAWFVGDVPVDETCAEAAKVHFIAATYGIGHVTGKENSRIGNFAELLKKIPLN